MKTPKALALAVSLLSFLALSLYAGGSEKEVTVHGEGMCAKCALKETQSCQNAIQVTNEEGKTETIYLAKNDTSKAFHKNLCKKSAKVVATGTISKDEDGHKVMTVSRIDLDS